MMRWFTARPRSKLSLFETLLPKGWRAVVWNCIQTRRASCTAKMRIAELPMPTSGSSSSGTRFVRASREGKAGKFLVNFLPAVSDEAMKAMSRELRSWRIDERSDKSLGDLAHMFNVVLQGWINYYGRFYKSMLYRLLRRINEYLVRWAKRKYKSLQRHDRRARRWLVNVARREPKLFAHWRLGRAARRLDNGSRVSCEVHARFYQSREV